MIVELLATAPSVAAAAFTWWVVWWLPGPVARVAGGSLQRVRGLLRFLRWWRVALVAAGLMGLAGGLVVGGAQLVGSPLYALLMCLAARDVTRRGVHPLRRRLVELAAQRDAPELERLP